MIHRLVRCVMTATTGKDIGAMVSEEPSRSRIRITPASATSRLRRPLGLQVEDLEGRLLLSMAAVVGRAIGPVVIAPAESGRMMAGVGSKLETRPGEAVSGVVASFLEVDPSGELDHLSATIAWGDGTFSPGTIEPDGLGGFQVIGSKVYHQVGIHPVVVTVTDDAGASARAEATAVVTELSAQVIGAPSSRGDGGIGIGSIDDPGPTGSAPGTAIVSRIPRVFGAMRRPPAGPISSGQRPGEVSDRPDSGVATSPIDLASSRRAVPAMSASAAVAARFDRIQATSWPAWARPGRIRSLAR